MSRPKFLVILTGAGKAFIDRIEPAGFDFFTPRGYDKIYREGHCAIAQPLVVAKKRPQRRR